MIWTMLLRTAGLFDRYAAVEIRMGVGSVLCLQEPQWRSLGVSHESN
jgi:hypothetical protein